MVSRVRKMARPTRTILGGFCWVPMAVRRKDREMTYLAKDVIITAREGSRVIMVVRNRI